MKLTLFAATGGVGRHVLNQALNAGHDVTVVVRDRTKIDPGVRTVVADLSSANSNVLEDAVRGADAVISCLGPRSIADAGIAAHGTRAIMRAMDATGVKRIVVISAAPVASFPLPGQPRAGRTDPGDDFLTRFLVGPVIKRVFRKVYDDLVQMEQLLLESNLEWTVIRPPRLTDKARAKAYRTAVGQNVRGGHTIARADVADLMLGTLARPDTIRRAVGVAN
jgi:putative NADH-flavin reductase